MSDLKYEMDEYGNVRAVSVDGASGGSAEDHIASLKQQLNKKPPQPAAQQRPSAETEKSGVDKDSDMTDCLLIAAMIVFGTMLIALLLTNSGRDKAGEILCLIFLSISLCTYVIRRVIS